MVDISCGADHPIELFHLEVDPELNHMNSNPELNPGQWFFSPSSLIVRKRK